MKLTGAGARRFTEKPDPSIGAALFYGPNRGLIAEAATSLIKALLKGDKDPYAITRLTDEELKSDKASLADALAARSLLGDARLVRVRLEGEAASALALEALKAIEAGSPSAFLLVESFSSSASSALVKGFEKAERAVSIAYYDDSASDLDQFALDVFKAQGAQISPEGLKAFRATVTADRTAVKAEAEKLALYVHGQKRPISPEDVDALLGDSAVGQQDQACRQALDGQAALAIETLERLDGVAPIVSLKALQRRLVRMMEARLEVDRGQQPLAAIKALKPPVFWKDQEPMAEQVRAWPFSALDSALSLTWHAEIACKKAGAPQRLIVAQCYRSVAKLRAAAR
ncbi:MAG: DNA polymerase III subunit delta [Caulobacterales bacterium]